MKSRCKNTIELNRWVREKGSSSVLVIMIMLLLITFGVLAMMSSYSNLKIARKHAEWTQEYYKLESLAEADLMTFELIYQAALKASSQVISDGKIDLSKNINLPDDVKVIIESELVSIKPSDSKALNTLIDKLFLYNLYDLYQASPLFENHNFSNFDLEIITVMNDSKWKPELSFISKDIKTDRSLLVKIEIDPSSEILLENGFKIIEWREVPADFDYNNSIGFEDPEGN